MTCEICKSNYDNGLPKCPYCGLNNPNFGFRQCINCGEKMDDDERFCSSCGALQQLPPQENCVNCNTKLKPNAVFCTQCGTAVGSASIRKTAVSIVIPESELDKAIPAKNAELPIFNEHESAPINSPTVPSIPNSEMVTPSIDPIPTSPTTSNEESKSIVEVPITVPTISHHEVSAPVVNTPSASAMPVKEDFASIGNDPTPVVTIDDEVPIVDHIIEAATKPATEILTVPTENLNKVEHIEITDSQIVSHKSGVISPTDSLHNEPEVISAPNGINAPSPMSMHDQLFSMEEKIPTPNIPTVETKPQKTKTRKGNSKRLIMLAIIAVILALIGLIAYIWIKLVPNSFTSNLKLPKPLSQTRSELDDTTTPVDGEHITTETPIVDYKYKSVEVIPPQWDEVSAFDDHGIAKVRSDDVWGLINKQGDYYLPPTYDSISQFSEGLSPVKSGDKFGFIDTNGTLVIPLEYDSATEFSEGLSLVAKNNRYYYINSVGDVKDFGGELSTPFSEGFAAILSLKGCYYIDTNGEKVSSDYDEAGRFSESVAPVRMDTSWGYVDTSFNRIIDFEYDEAGSFLNGFAIVKKDGKKFLINKLGNQASPTVDEIWQFKENIATVKEAGLFGFVDGSSDQYLIPPQYIDVYAFSEDKAAVSLNQGIWYYIDTANQPLFHKQFDDAHRFKDNFASVKIENLYTVIDSDGNRAIEDSWELVGTFGQNLLPVLKDGKWGFVEIVPQ